MIWVFYLYYSLLAYKAYVGENTVMNLLMFSNLQLQSLFVLQANMARKRMFEERDLVINDVLTWVRKRKNTLSSNFAWEGVDDD